MNYLKFYNGGNVIKRFQAGGQFTSMTPFELATLMEWANKLGINTGGNPLTDDQIASVTSNARFLAFNPNFRNSSNSFNTTPTTLTDEDVTRMRSLELTTLDSLADMKAPGKIIADTSPLRLDSTGKPVGHINVGEEGAGTVAATGTNTPLTGSELPTSTGPQVNKTFANYATAAAGTIAGLVGGQPAADSVNMVSQVAQNPEMAGTSAGKAAMGLGVISAAGNMVDKAVMGDKNFGTQSAAIDGLVHGASKALMSSGNPYCVCKGTKLFVNGGLLKNIEDITYSDTVAGFDNGHVLDLPVEHIFPKLYKECILIETTKGNILKCSIDHPILTSINQNGKKRNSKIIQGKRVVLKKFDFVQAGDLKVDDYVAEVGSVPLFGTTHIKDAYLIGMLIGDGTYRKKSVPLLTTTDPDTWVYLETRKLGSLKRIDYTSAGKEVRYYGFNGYQLYMRDLGIFGQTGSNKRLPTNVMQWDKLSCAELIAGLVDTDGYVLGYDSKHAGIFFCQSNYDLILLIKYLLLKFGIHCTIIKNGEKQTGFGKQNYKCKTKYLLCIKQKESVVNFYNNINLNISYKQRNLEKAYSIKISKGTKDNSYEYLNLVSDKIRRIIPLGVCEVYNLLVGISHTFIAENIVTHNCMAAGAALETGNFLTKAGGQTVQGFDVDINSSGYGNMGHKESSSSRDFGAAIGLGGLNAAATQRKLKKRNEEAQMALKASNVADTIQFEQEARMNSVDDVIQQNEIALQGGIDTSVLAAKHGARLERIKKQRKCINPDLEEVIIHEEVIIEQPEEVIIESPIVKAQNGAKLEHIEVSEEQNVIPSGAMHKNKNHIDLDITEKGIPVITVEDDSAETFEDIKEQEDTLIQHAEVEEAEIIFNKELTIFIENLRKLWHEKDKDDDSICLEAGMRLAKEIIENTEDNTDVTEKSMEAVDNENN